MIAMLLVLVGCQRTDTDGSALTSADLGPQITVEDVIGAELHTCQIGSEPHKLLTFDAIPSQVSVLRCEPAGTGTGDEICANFTDWEVLVGSEILIATFDEDACDEGVHYLISYW